jgi:tRNA nucleotidyltransferase/poly(A) polymerase
VTEEVYKILTSGSSAEILSLAFRLRLFDVLFPALCENVKNERHKFEESRLSQRLLELDRETREGKVLPRDEMFAFLFRDVVEGRPDLLHEPDPAFLIQQFIRTAAEPLFPSKKDLAVATHGILKDHRRPPHRPARADHAPPREGGRPRGRRRGRRRRRPQAGLG